MDDQAAFLLGIPQGKSIAQAEVRSLTSLPALLTRINALNRARVGVAAEPEPTSEAAARQQAARVSAAIKRGFTGTWGLYDMDGRALALFDTFISLDTKRESRVTSNPVEKGSFVSYNKTSQPIDVHLKMACTASASVRTIVLDKLEELAATTQVISVVTPDRTFSGYTLASFDYSYSSEHGVDRLMVHLALNEIREVTPEYTDLPPQKCKKASSASTQDRGKQPAQEPPKPAQESVLHAIAGKILPSGENLSSMLKPGGV